MLFADTHSHFLLNAHYLGREFARGGRDRIPWGPFGNRLDLDGCLAGGLGCVTFAVYVPWSPLAWVRRSDATIAQIRAFQRLVRRSEGRVVPVRTGTEARAVAESGRLAAVLAVEGGHSLDGDLRNLDALAALGVRMLTLTHFEANALADSSGSSRRPHRGLSPLGRLAVREMERNRVVPDVAHMTDEGVRQLLDAATGPVACSHTGMRALCNIPRNLPDDLARGVARTGGVLGIILFPRFLTAGAWRVPLDRFLDHVAHAAAVAGPEHVAIGTDMDGLTWTPDGFRGPRDLPALADAMSRRGFSAAEIRGIAGDNYLRMLE